RSFLTGRESPDILTRCAPLSQGAAPSPALRAPSPPVGEGDGGRGCGSWAGSAGRALNRYPPLGERVPVSLVTQVGNLLFRRLAVGSALGTSSGCGLPIRDTADCQSALPDSADPNVGQASRLPWPRSNEIWG